MALKTKKLGPFTFKIDRPKGYVKTWNKGQDNEKSYTYPCDYGFFPGIKGEDGEGLDAFVGNDPDGHMACFLKLKKDEQGNLVPDETKFVLGVTEAQAKKIYALYGEEITDHRVFNNYGEVYSAVHAFKPKKKARYSQDADEQQKAAMLDACTQFGVKGASMDKLIQGKVIAAKPADVAKQAAFDAAYKFAPSLAAAYDAYSASREQQAQMEAQNFPALHATQPAMLQAQQQMAYGMDPSGGQAFAAQPVHHRHRRHHSY